MASSLLEEMRKAEETYPGQRPGQILFNYYLPSSLREALRGTYIDPFYIRHWEQLASWIDCHLILDHNHCTVLAAFTGDNVIWEAPAH